jgi:hypothetical protein
MHLSADMDRVWGGRAPPVCQHGLSDWGHSVAGTGLVDLACRARLLLSPATRPAGPAGPVPGPGMNR